MPGGRRSKDTLVVFLGLMLVIGIGSWSFFRSGKIEGTPEVSPGVAPEESTGDFRKISLEELKDIVLQKNTERGALIIDTRPASLWSDEHIIGSKNILFEEAKQSLRPTDTEKAKDWIVVAPDTSSARHFATLLLTREIPRERISIFDGTHETWREKTGLVIRMADPTFAPDATKVTLASPEEAKTKIKKGGRWFILDVRPSDSFVAGHIAGAVSIPFADIEEKRWMIPSTASILVYGDHDRESFAAGVLLFDLGFFNTTTLSAGFDEWKAKNLPTDK